MNTNTFSKLIGILVILSIVLSACTTAPGIVSEQSQVYLAWDPESDAGFLQFRAQSSYTGMTYDELAQYYFTMNVKYTAVTRDEFASLYGLQGTVYAFPLQSLPQELAGASVLPTIAQAAPLAMLAGGTVIAGAAIASPDYQAKMQAMAAAKAIPADAVILIPQELAPINVPPSVLVHAMDGSQILPEEMGRLILETLPASTAVVSWPANSQTGFRGKNGTMVKITTTTLANGGCGVNVQTYLHWEDDQGVKWDKVFMVNDHQDDPCNRRFVARSVIELAKLINDFFGRGEGLVKAFWAMQDTMFDLYDCIAYVLTIVW